MTGWAKLPYKWRGSHDVNKVEDFWIHSVLVFLLERATYEDNPPLKRGQLYMSRYEITREIPITGEKVRTILKKLCSLGHLTIERVAATKKVGSIYTLVNYDANAGQISSQTSIVDDQSSTYTTPMKHLSKLSELKEKLMNPTYEIPKENLKDENPSPENIEGLRDVAPDQRAHGHVRKKEKKERKNIYSSKSESNPICNELIEIWNSKLDDSLGKVVKMSPARERAVKRFLDDYSLDDFKTLVEKAAQSDFLQGRNQGDRKWRANFDWCLNPNNSCKIIEGNYDEVKPKIKLMEVTDFGKYLRER